MNKDNYVFGYQTAMEEISKRACNNCKHLDEETANIDEGTHGFCVLWGLSHNDRPFKSCSDWEQK